MSISIYSGRISATENASAQLESFGLNLNRFVFTIIDRIENSDFNIIDSYVEASKNAVAHGEINDIPNWDKSAKELLLDSDIWFATEEDINKPIAVFNRFTHNNEDYYIPYTNYQEEKEIEIQNNHNGENQLSTTPDYLAFYAYGPGCIVLMVDRIQNIISSNNYRAEESIILYKKILLHELIHSCLDVYPRNTHGKISYFQQEWVSKNGKFNEESIDNAIVLQCFKQHEEYPLVKNFISLQPYYYSNALSLRVPKIIETFTSNLIKHKISKPMFVLCGVSYAKIGQLAKEIIGKIISTQNLATIKTEIPPCYIADKSLYEAHRAEISSKASPCRYYVDPVKSKDGYEVYISSQWWEHDIRKLLDLIEAYPHLFPGGLTIL